MITNDGARNVLNILFQCLFALKSIAFQGLDISKFIKQWIFYKLKCIYVLNSENNL